MNDFKAPARRPCSACPYRRDSPSGLWAAVEYNKLPAYDRDTGEQPSAPFACHEQTGRLCAGWVAVHDMPNNLAMRLGLSMGHVHPDVFDECVGYETDVDLFVSGEEARQHGLRDLDHPSYYAKRKMERLLRDRNAEIKRLLG